MLLYLLKKVQRGRYGIYLGYHRLVAQIPKAWEAEEERRRNEGGTSGRVLAAPHLGTTAAVLRRGRSDTSVVDLLILD